MRTVKFIKSHPPFKVGDIAGFSEAEADGLVKEGLADLYIMGLKTEKVEEKTEVKEVKKEVVKPPVDKMIKSPKIKK
jgi:hypothetical protein